MGVKGIGLIGFSCLLLVFFSGCTTFNEEIRGSKAGSLYYSGYSVGLSGGGELGIEIAASQERSSGNYVGAAGYVETAANIWNQRGYPMAAMHLLADDAARDYSTARMYSECMRVIDGANSFVPKLGFLSDKEKNFLFISILKSKMMNCYDKDDSGPKWLADKDVFEKMKGRYDYSRYPYVGVRAKGGVKLWPNLTVSEKKVLLDDFLSKPSRPVSRYKNYAELIEKEGGELMSYLPNLKKNADLIKSVEGEKVIFEYGVFRDVAKKFFEGDPAPYSGCEVLHAASLNYEKIGALQFSKARADDYKACMMPPPFLAMVFQSNFRFNDRKPFESLSD